MTVAELIERLKKYSGDEAVTLFIDGKKALLMSVIPRPINSVTEESEATAELADRVDETTMELP